MSRSYRKFVKLGMCGGFGNQNTGFYKNRRRKISNKNKQIVRDAVAHYNPEDIDDHVQEYRPPKRDDWAEPSDGTFILDKKDADRIINNEKSPVSYKEFITRKILPKLKRKK